MEHHYFNLTPDPQGVLNKHYKDYSLQKHRNQYTFPRRHLFAVVCFKHMLANEAKPLVALCLEKIVHKLRLFASAKENVPRGTF